MVLSVVCVQVLYVSFGLCFGAPCLCAGLMLHHFTFVGSKAMCLFMHICISRVCSMKIVVWNTTPTTRHIPQWIVVLQGFLAMNHIISGSDAADIASKHWTHEAAWPLIEPLFDHAGDAGELCVDDVEPD